MHDGFWIWVGFCLINMNGGVDLSFLWSLHKKIWNQVALFWLIGIIFLIWKYIMVWTRRKDGDIAVTSMSQLFGTISDQSIIISQPPTNIRWLPIGFGLPWISFASLATNFLKTSIFSTYPSLAASGTQILLPPPTNICWLPIGFGLPWITFASLALELFENLHIQHLSLSCCLQHSNSSSPTSHEGTDFEIPSALLVICYGPM